MIRREVKRAKLITKFKSTRSELRNKIKNSSSFEEQIAASVELQKLPKDSCSTRRQNRCRVCGRPHAVYRQFGLCRIHLREFLSKGYCPGLQLASWG